MLLRKKYKVASLLLLIFLLTTIVTGSSEVLAARKTSRIVYTYNIKFTYPNNCGYKVIYNSPYKFIIRYPDIGEIIKPPYEPPIIERPEPSKPEIPEKPEPSKPEIPEKPEPEEKPIESSYLSKDEEKMIELVNSERLKLGLSPLKADEDLVKLGRMKSSDMINKNYFDHNSPTYGSPFDMLKSYGVSYGYAGENIAGAPNVERAHTALMNSPGHRRNILNSNYTHIGIGIIDGGPYGKMFTQLFISK